MGWTDKVFFELNRPEYARTPEMLSSALVHDLYQKVRGVSDNDEDYGDNRPVGFVFERRDNAERKSLRIVQTRPAEGVDLGKWKAELAVAGLEVDAVDPDRVAGSLLDALRGVTAPEAKGRAAIPLVRGTALLQDARGMHAKASPPSYARILNQLFAAGTVVPVGPKAASEMWHECVLAPSAHPLVDVVAKATDTLGPLGQGALVKVPADRSRETPGDPAPAWLVEAGTPFTWFHEQWTAFCGNEWRNALPRRRWADWAAAILRTAIGMGFLWEARFYRSLVQHLLSDEVEPGRAALRVLRGDAPLLAWSLAESPLGSRDVNQGLQRLIIDGVQCRAELSSIEEGRFETVCAALGLENLAEGERFRDVKGLERWIESARRVLKHPEFAEDRGRLEAAFGSPRKSSHGNVIETVVYALQCRKEFGADADQYSLLRRRSRRFLVVEPGPEWIVVLASMAAGRPGAATTLKRLREQLALLGLRPPREVVVRELERAGLSRSSHDADDAIEVSSGFAEVTNAR